VPPIVTQPAGNVINLGVATPTGACGLRKAAYMNEIVVALHWQKTKEQVSSLQPAEWTLWAAMYVEMINPYSDEAMPRVSIKERYQIICDGDFAFNGTMQSPPGSISASLSKPQILVDTAGSDIKHLVPINNYSYALQNPTGQAQTAPYSYLFGGNKFAVKVGIRGDPAKTPAEAKPPFLSDLKVTLPLRIRHLALPSVMAPGARAENYIADWFDATTPGQVAPQVLDICQGGKVQPAVLAASEGLREPTVEELLRTTNPARVSIAKDDPRVRCWYGPFTGGQITIALTGHNATMSKNANTTQADSKVGDGETRSTPERYSNFVIAERGMQSIGEIGFIHTGKPWRSLSLQRYGLMPDEQGAAAAARIPDWAILDLLTVHNKPICGRINVNNAGWHCGYNSDWETKTQPNLFEAWGSLNSWGQAGRRNAATNPGTCWSHTLSAALNFIRNTTVRDNLVQSIVRRIVATGPVTNPNASGVAANPFVPYLCLGELAELRYMNQWDISSSNPATTAVTDAQKEETLRRICNVLTTCSDVFTVHAIGQAFGNGRLTGEARLMAVVQRVNEYDTGASMRSLSNPGWYRFRIRHLQWVHND
ncbi:MAG: hypothetical protein N2689_01630, partial [Verrucomicrobiae bacterium]|nr:hypothetical protein [Verrucomicrobiae bacterium]